MSAHDSPAFPVPSNTSTNPGASAYGMIGHPGMTLRDYFAAHVITGLFAQSNDTMLEATCREGLALGEKTTALTYAREAYIAADAMLAERTKEAK